MAIDTPYRAQPQDARHGGLVIAAGGAVTPGLARVAEGFAADGYETVCVAASQDLPAALQRLAAPRLLIGLRAGAQRAWTAAEALGGMTAMALFYPDELDGGAPPCPAILHLTRVQAAAWPQADAPTVFVYGAQAGFYLDDDPAHDAAAARLARLRTLALFRRSLGRGEA